jgi:hypothetical protein
MKPIKITILATILQLPSHAALTYIDTSPIRALIPSETNEWDVFTEAWADPNSPDVIGEGTASIIQTIPGAFITSGGNIYAPSSLTNYQLTYAAGFINSTTSTYIGNVVLQLATFGSTLDYPSMTLTYTDNASQTFVAAPVGFQNDPTVISFIPPGGPPTTSTNDLVAFQWNLDGLEAVSFTIGFSSAGTSMSLGGIALDTASTGSPFQALVIPEPQTALLFSIASAALLLRRRKTPAI